MRAVYLLRRDHNKGARIKIIGKLEQVLFSWRVTLLGSRRWREIRRN